MDSEPAWKQLALSLERPYKDDDGQHILPLLDITPDGQHIYEPRQDRETRLGVNFNRIFLERGTDFFQKSDRGVIERKDASAQDAVTEDEDARAKEDVGTEDHESKPMTPEMLFNMRMEIIPQLHVALGEMSHARDLLSLLLSSNPIDSTASSSLPPHTLKSTTVSKLPDIPSVQTFNAQLVVGGKDEALRKASSVLKSASESMSRVTTRNTRYWEEALEIRRNNWDLVPAPLPLGSATGKGADKTSKDFLICYGLEEAPPHLQRRALSKISNNVAESSDGLLVIFPSRQKTRLRVALNIKDDNGSATSQNAIKLLREGSANEALRSAQWEVVEQELFSELIKEAGHLPTTEARVAERLIVIEAAQGVELQFELVENELIDPSESLSSSSSRASDATCDLIYAALLILMLRAHAFNKTFRLGVTNVMRAAGIVKPQASPQILQPIIDMIQYHVFCKKIETVLTRMTRSLETAGVSSTLRFDPLGESGEQLIASLFNEPKTRTSGEAVLRVGARQSIRFTFSSPSSLVAHLPQATVPISSVPQLCQLLADEVERGLLIQICQIGTKTCNVSNSTWFVDEMMSRTVGRWEGCVLNLRVTCSADFAIDCMAYSLSRENGKSVPSTIKYSAREATSRGLLDWVEHIVGDRMEE